jgi:hypothetical protein
MEWLKNLVASLSGKAPISSGSEASVNLNGVQYVVQGGGKPQDPPFAADDDSPLARVVRRIGELGRYPSDTTSMLATGVQPDLPMLTLEEFFEGNDFEGSFMCNVDPPVAIADVYKFLKKVRSREDVSDVRIMVTQLDNYESWPFSDTIWVVTKAEPEIVRSWFEKKYPPDEVAEGFHDHYRCEKIDVAQGFRAVSLWYD